MLRESSKAISNWKSFFLSLTVFFAIILEGFEVVLFTPLYLLLQFTAQCSVAGAISGTLALVFVLFWSKQNYKNNSLGTFFRISSILLLLLSVYFGYEGVKELYAGLRELKVI
jgi:high-affinity iron transporter